MGPYVHRASIRITHRHCPLSGQCLDLSDRPPGTLDLLANLAKLLVGPHAQSPAGPARVVEISGGSGGGFDEHQVVVSVDVDDREPRIGRGRSEFECERRSKQLRVVRHESVEVGGG